MDEYDLLNEVLIRIQNNLSPAVCQRIMLIDSENPVYLNAAVQREARRFLWQRARRKRTEMRILTEHKAEMPRPVDLDHYRRAREAWMEVEAMPDRPRLITTLLFQGLSSGAIRTVISVSKHHYYKELHYAQDRLSIVLREESL